MSDQARSFNGRAELREQVARRAALLLYFGVVKDFLRAKESAAEELGITVLPSNSDVAMELDRLAQEMEGAAREERLVRLRREALKVMKSLSAFHPRLVGSVWRGTAHKGSDVDILVFHSKHDEVEDVLERAYTILKAGWTSKTDAGTTERYYHIHLASDLGVEVEVSVRKPEKIDVDERCEIYGDVKRGLTLDELERVLERDSLRRFLPKKR